jgi:hypothetical protein
MWTLTKNKLKFVKEKMNDLEYVDLSNSGNKTLL